MLEIAFDKNVFEFLVGLRKYRKAFKKAASLQQAFDVAEDAMGIAERVIDELRMSYSLPEMQEIVRNSMAYAWEIGKGAKLVPQLDASADNPFLNPRWAEAVSG